MTCDSSFTNAVRASIATVMKEIREKTSDFESLTGTVFDLDTAWNWSTSPLLSIINAHALKYFYSLLWFRRLWVVQEAALAPGNRCHLGNHQFELSDVLAVARWLCYKVESISRRLDDLCFRVSNMWVIVEEAKPPKSGAPLDRLLRISREFLTSEPRDKVYAVLGLMRWSQKAERLPSLLVPDYQRPIGEVFADAIRYAIEEDGELSNLGEISHRSSAELEDESLPSWTPRRERWWDDDDDPGNLPIRIYSADKGRNFTFASHDQSLRSDCLLVVGYICNEVLRTTPVLAERILKRSDSQRFRDWMQEVSSTSEGCADKLAVVAMRTADLNTDGDRATTNDPGGHDDTTPTLQNEDRLPVSRKDMTDSTTPKERRASKYCDALGAACFNRTAFSTRFGSLGLGPKITKKGDLVVVLYGSRMPVVLRQYPDGCYRQVGLSYVHDIMDGEASRKHKEEGGQDVVFNIR